MRSLKSVLFVVAILAATSVFAHGEGSLGPHHGYIRMPGAFHTELVPTATANVVQVYLLDINFKNPSVTASSVEVTRLRPAPAPPAKATCQKESLYFSCRFDASVDLEADGKLVVLATREKQKGVAAEYVTPLKLNE